MFVLAHLSDPHLAPLPKPRLLELLNKRATGYLNWRRRRRLVHKSEVLARIVADLKAQAPDHIAVTGDLVNIALAAEYAPARAWLAALGSPQDVTLVPGNHDAYVRAGLAAAQQHWDACMVGDTSAGDRFPFVRRRAPLALIGLSSAAPTPPFMATGKLGADQLSRLGPLLDRAREDGLFRVVLLHHPPVSKPSRRFKRLLDGEALRTVLAQHSAELLLHGHDHEHALVWLTGYGKRIPAVGVPSASEAPPGNHDTAGYNLYRIDGEAGSWRCEMISRGLAADGESIIERGRMMLYAD